jgi:hypothetical protein
MFPSPASICKQKHALAFLSSTQVYKKVVKSVCAFHTNLGIIIYEIEE